MRLLYIYEYFTFPESNGGTRTHDLSCSFVQKGIQVDVITSSAHIPLNLLSKKKWTVLRYKNVNIHILNCKYDNKMTFYRRVFSFLDFMFNASFKALSMRADLVLASSTPLTIGVPALIKRYIQGTPYVFEVRDVWPDVPVKLGFIKSKVLIRFLYFIEKLIYKKAFKVVPLSIGMQQSIRERCKVDSTLVIPNISEIDRFQFVENIYNNHFENKKVLIYAGTIGFANDISFLVRLATLTKENYPDLIYCVFGRGNEYDEIKCLAIENDVLDKNFYLCDPIAKSELPALYNSATFGSSFVRNNKVMWDNSANKYFDCLAAGRPIIINHEGWQADEIRKENIGYVLPAVLDDCSVSAFIDYVNNDNLQKDQRVNARKLAESKYSLQIATEKYMSIFNEFNEFNV